MVKEFFKMVLNSRRKFSLLMAIGVTPLSPIQIFQLTTHQPWETMRISHMDLQHSKDRDLCRIISSNMVNMVSKDNNNRTAKGLRIRAREGLSLMKNR